MVVSKCAVLHLLKVHSFAVGLLIPFMRIIVVGEGDCMRWQPSTQLSTDRNQIAEISIFRVCVLIEIAENMCSGLIQIHLSSLLLSFHFKCN